MRHHIEKRLMIGLLITVEPRADVAPTALGERVTELKRAQTSATGRYAWMTLVGTWTLFSLAFVRNAAQDLAALRILSSLSSTDKLRRAVSIGPNNVEARARLLICACRVWTLRSRRAAYQTICTPSAVLPFSDAIGSTMWF
jgi:hypothetical protein